MPTSSRARVLPWAEIVVRAHAFVREWQGETREHAEGQSFWNDFFEVFGQKRKAVARFEHHASRYSTGGGGSLDVFWPNVIAAEHKSAGKSLDDAEEQLFDYDIPVNQTPQLYVVTNFARVRVVDLEAGERKEFDLSELPENVHWFAPVAGYRREPFREEEAASIEAAEILGKLYDHLNATGYRGHQLRVLIVRLLFCVFADDTNVWRRGMFRELLEFNTSEDGSDLGPRLDYLFQLLNQPENKRQQNISDDWAAYPYINGGLFHERIPTATFDAKGRELLIDAARFNWSSVSPIIFGSLFQSVKDKRTRRAGGEHYTSEENILKAMRPLFLDDLEEAYNSAATNLGQLTKLHTKIAGIRILDPAAGCGNFLAVAYRELRKLETKILTRQSELRGHQQQVLDLERVTKVRVSQFYGIEIEEFQARIAQTAMYLIDHMQNVALAAEFGEYYARFPIETEATIEIANALTVDWNSILPASECDYVVGNPPYAGKKEQSTRQKQDMKAVFGIKGGGVLDYVAGWFQKAAAYALRTKIRVAFVATNSITQGEQPHVLWGYLWKLGVTIHFAHDSFKWTNEARGKAAVYCVIIGFATFPPQERALYELQPDGATMLSRPANINPYLVDAPDTVLDNRRVHIQPAAPEMTYGSFILDDGNFTLSAEDRAELLRQDPRAAPYIRPFIGGVQLLKGQERFCLWLDGMSSAALRSIRPVRQRVEAVRDWRASSARPQTKKLAATPTQWAEVRQPKSDYVAIPTLSSHLRDYIPVGFLPPSTIASNQVYILSDVSEYEFGILHSRMHMAWVKYVAGRFKLDYRYSIGIVYNHFIWPTPSAAAKKRVMAAAAQVLAVRRRHPDRSLSDLYDPLAMPADLRKAHRRLDREVDKTYRRGKFLSDRERVEHLFVRHQRHATPLMKPSKKLGGGRKPGRAPQS